MKLRTEVLLMSAGVTAIDTLIVNIIVFALTGSPLGIAASVLVAIGCCLVAFLSLCLLNTGKQGDEHIYEMYAGDDTLDATMHSVGKQSVSETMH